MHIHKLLVGGAASVAPISSMLTSEKWMCDKVAFCHLVKGPILLMSHDSSHYKDRPTRCSESAPMECAPSRWRGALLPTAKHSRMVSGLQRDY